MSTRIPSAGRPGATPAPEPVTAIAPRASASADAPAADGIEPSAADSVFARLAAPGDDPGAARYADHGGLRASLTAEAAVGLRALATDASPAFCAPVAQLFAALDAAARPRG